MVSLLYMYLCSGVRRGNIIESRVQLNFIKTRLNKKDKTFDHPITEGFMIIRYIYIIYIN